MGRPFDRHIDNQELNALVPSFLVAEQEVHGVSPDVVWEAERHVESCRDCARRVSEYRQLVNRFSNTVVSEAAPPRVDCPKDKDVDWNEVAAGLWPELKARQLIMHSALCDHCGPLLRAATSVDDDPTPQEEKQLAELKAPSRPDSITRPVRAPQPSWQFMRWLVPAVTLMVIVAVLATRPSSSPTLLSGPRLGEFAVSTHRQFTQGNLALDVRTGSQQALNEWFRTNSPFSIALPDSPTAPDEEQPYRLEGARLVQASGKIAAYIAYWMQTGPVGLMVTPDSVAIASGGVQVDFKKVHFHYAMVDGYRVVTWSVHGLTYALVSREGNSTQQSCMVCHSAMRDRDLSHTPTPFHANRNAIVAAWQ